MITASSESMPPAKLKSQGFILKSLIMVLFAGTNWAFTAGFSASQETRLIFKSAPFQRGKFAGENKYHKIVFQTHQNLLLYSNIKLPFWLNYLKWMLYKEKEKKWNRNDLFFSPVSWKCTYFHKTLWKCFQHIQKKCS